MVPLAPLIAGLLLGSGCLLETTTGVPKALGAAYTTAPSGDHGNTSVEPWVGYEGETVTLSGVVTAAAESPVDLDFWVPDASALGGWTILGRKNLGAPGVWSIDAPVGFGELVIEGFQDAYGDGPTPDDPYGRVAVSVGDAALEVPEFALDEANQLGALNQRLASLRPFADYDGPTVTLSGTLSSDVVSVVTLDLRAPMDEYGDEYKLIGVIVLEKPGAWKLKVPQSFGELRVEAFQDQRGDGIGPDDTYGSAAFQIGDADISDSDLTLEAGAYESGGGGARRPFEGYKGERVRIVGEIVAELAMPVQIDVRSVDPEAEGGLSEEGRLVLAMPKRWTMRAPKDHGELMVQAFQDITGDGPSDDDPFGFLTLAIADVDLMDQDLVLEVGGKEAMAKAMGHGGGEFAIKTCDQWDGPVTTITGVITGGNDQPITVDFRVADPEAEFGMAALCRQRIDSPGAFEVGISTDKDEVFLEVYQDVDQNGPSDEDPYAGLALPLDGEPVTDVALELVVGARSSAPAGGDGPPSGGSPRPFRDYDGEWVIIRGTVAAPQDVAVHFDFAVPDAKEPGGRRRLGMESANGPGAYELKVPKGLGSLALEVFQDPDKDGPTDNDPYATAQVTVGDEDLELDVRLVEGARGQPTGGGDPNGGDPNADGGGGGGGGGNSPESCFADLGSEPVTLSGSLGVADGVEPGLVKLDLYAPDSSSQAGRRRLCSIQFPLGGFSFKAPQEFGALELEGCIDLENDGPSSGDPCGYYKDNPVDIDDENISGVFIQLQTRSSSSEDGL